MEGIFIKKCKCGNLLKGSYLKKYGYNFTCIECGKKYKSIWYRIREVL